MTGFIDHITETLAQIEADGLTKRETADHLAAGRACRRWAGAMCINLCANNYLGLADHPDLIARRQRRRWTTHGYGMASVRFICGTQDLHRALETRLAAFLGKDDAILFAACFDANGGLFEPLLGPEDAIISDALNHASIIDGIRLCKAQALSLRQFRHGRSGGAAADRPRGRRAPYHDRDRWRVLDGRLPGEAGRRSPRWLRTYDAVVMVDDCHATGFMGPQGRGTPHHGGCRGRIDPDRHAGQGAGRRASAAISRGRSR